MSVKFFGFAEGSYSDIESLLRAFKTTYNYDMRSVSIIDIMAQIKYILDYNGIVSPPEDFVKKIFELISKQKFDNDAVSKEEQNVLEEIQKMGFVNDLKKILVDRDRFIDIPNYDHFKDIESFNLLTDSRRDDGCRSINFNGKFVDSIDKSIIDIVKPQTAPDSFVRMVSINQFLDKHTSLKVEIETISNTNEKTKNYIFKHKKEN